MELLRRVAQGRLAAVLGPRRCRLIGRFIRSTSVAPCRRSSSGCRATRATGWTASSPGSIITSPPQSSRRLNCAWQASRRPLDDKRCRLDRQIGRGRCDVDALFGSSPVAEPARMARHLVAFAGGGDDRDGRHGERRQGRPRTSVAAMRWQSPRRTAQQDGPGSPGIRIFRYIAEYLAGGRLSFAVVQSRRADVSGFAGHVYRAQPVSRVGRRQSAGGQQRIVRRLRTGRSGDPRAAGADFRPLVAPARNHAARNRVAARLFPTCHSFRRSRVRCWPCAGSVIGPRTRLRRCSRSTARATQHRSAPPPTGSRFLLKICSTPPRAGQIGRVSVAWLPRRGHEPPADLVIAARPRSPPGRSLPRRPIFRPSAIRRRGLSCRRTTARRCGTCRSAGSLLRPSAPNGWRRCSQRARPSGSMIWPHCRPMSRWRAPRGCVTGSAPA